MKVKHLFLAALAAVFTFAACQEKLEDLGEPNIDLSTTTLEFEQGASSQTITLNATRAWKAKDVADWIVVEPASGKASKEDQTVTITVLENTDMNRSCTIDFYAGIVSGYLTVNQAGPGGGVEPGDGSLEHPYLASQANALASALESGAEDGPYYIKGFVKKFGSKHEEGVKNFGNALFYITDTPDGEGDDFYCYQVYYLGGKKFTSLDQIKEGDEVIVYGKITNYQGTPETVGKGAAFIYSLNGVIGDDGGPVQAVDATVAQVIEEQNKTVVYRLSGSVSRFNSQYCSFDLTDETGSIYVYSVTAATKEEYSTKLANGDTVTIEGEYQFYEKNSQHEIVNAKITEWTRGTDDGGGQTGDIVDATVSQVTTEQNTNVTYRLSGSVSGFNSQYCSFDITDATGKIYVYSVDAATKAEYSTKLANGDTVTIEGKYQYYAAKSQHEIVNAKITEWTRGTDDGGGQTGDIVDATVAEFIAAPVGNQNYRLKGTVKGPINTQYGNFDIVDETGSVYVYGTSNFADYKSQFAEGGTVTFVGHRGEYNGKVEVLDGYIEKYESGQGGDDGGQGGGDGVDPSTLTQITCAQFNALSSSDTAYYILEGDVTTVENTQYGNLYIKDASGEEAYIYGLNGENGEAFGTLNVAKGDKIKIYGQHTIYNNTTVEMKGAKLISLTKGQGGDDGNTGDAIVVLSFPDDNSANNKVNGYDKPWTAKSGKYSFAMTAFNNYNWDGWTYIRCGRKTASVASIATNEAISEAVSKVVIAIDKITASDINSISLIVAKDASFSNVVETVAVNAARGDVEASIKSPAAGLYYKLVFDCKASSENKNGFVQVSSFKFMK